MEINQPQISSPAKQVADFAAALRANAPDYDIEFSEEALQQLIAYYQIINNWNPRLHLVAPCSADEFAKRHILESLLLLRHLPNAARIIDVGSGAGLPTIPCLITRIDLSAVLIESAQRKAIFLREALALIGKTNAAEVIAQRFEDVEPPAAKFITARAVERFAEILPGLIAWAPRPSTLLLFGGSELKGKLEALGLKYEEMLIPNSERRFLFKVEGNRSPNRGNDHV
ncbi:MAG: class I SAM-dependent methyltransferase [Acidobacteriota bacterium]|nr:class I SAM-dependent methyltransferase [Acidobacteriota bacterium]